MMSTVGDVFDLLDDAEIAIESDPRTITPQMIAQIGMSGFTRASFGVQEFDPVVQLAINRVQPPKMVQNCVRDLRRAGVSGINFDLIYGLPHQTVDKLMKTIDLCVDMVPERIALFGYAHVPWMAKKQRLIDESALPGPDARLAQADAAAKALTAAGYVPIGLDHFARPADAMAQAAQDQTLRRNFQGYTTDQAETILGVGTTSIGRTPEGYVQNLTETRAWTRAIQMGHLPIARGLGFKGDDALRGHVIERLMCVGKVDLQAAAQRFGQGANWYHIHRPALDGLAADGLITIDGALLRITPKGAPLARVIASTFDRYLKESQSRHAAAV